jgi:hypothetical protein
MKEIDTWHTSAPVCPYCGHHESDPWEIDFGNDLEGEIEHSCSSCDREYLCERGVTIYYTSPPSSEPPL